MFEPEPTGMGQDHESRLSTQQKRMICHETNICGLLRTAETGDSRQGRSDRLPIQAP